MCKHELENLVGVAGGVICRKCGMRFDHIPKQDPAPVEQVEEKAEEKPKRTRAKKGAK